MGWLWACLGGGPGSLSSKRSKSLRAKLSNQPHDLRLQALPTQLSGHGYGILDPCLVQSLQGRVSRGGEADSMEAFEIPTSSVNTCISINSLKKASEKSLESSFRQEFGLTKRSDVDELKEELAALRRRLANEEAEAKKLREEVSYLRSCGVLQRSEDFSDTRIHDSVLEKEAPNDQVNEEQRQGDIAPVKQLRKCFSGPLLFGSQSTSSNHSTEDSSDSTRVSQSTQTRISSHRAGLSPKGKSFGQKAQLEEIGQKSEEGVVAILEFNPRVSKVSFTSGLHQYPSTKVAAWTSQITEESHGTSRNLTVTDSMDVHWIEIANAPAPSGFSTNVRRDRRRSSDHGESPRRPNLGALMVAEDDTSKKLIGKRRQKRSVDFTEPTEKRSREQSPTSQLPALTPEQIEEQLSQAVAAFKEQKRELELKHQTFCHGPTITNEPPPPANVAIFFRNSKRKVTRNTLGFQRALSPVKEALSIEEVTWSRQNSSRNESIVKPEDSPDRGANRLASTGAQGFKFAATIVEDSSPVRLPPEEEEGEEQEDELEDEGTEELDVRPTAMENIAMVPIQCISPSLTPKKKSASLALDALCAVAMSSKSPTDSRYHLEDSVETDWIHEWEDDVEGMDMKPIECASPSFSDRRKSARAGSVRQSISFSDTKESSPLLDSSGELEESYLSCGKSSPSPSRLAAYRSPASRSSVTPSPRKQWNPSPRKDVDSMINERSWYCDAIDAIRSINDNRRSKEGRLHTESVSLGNSPAGKKTGGARPPHAFSAEKKILRRAFSWYVSEHDDRMRTFGLKGTNEREQPEEGSDKKGLSTSRVQPQQKTALIASRAVSGAILHARRFSDSDSGASATFSIDFNRLGSSRNNSLNNSSQSLATESGGGGGGALEARESTGASVLRADKENSVSKCGLSSPSKSSILRKSDQSLSSSDSNKHLRRSQEQTIPENRPVLGSMPLNIREKNVRNSRDKNLTALHTEDSRSELHPVTLLQRASPKGSSRGISGMKIMSRSRSFV